MFLTVTEPAQKRLKMILEKHQGTPALYYSQVTGGYACGITGQFTLKLDSGLDDELDAIIDSTIGKIPVQSSRVDELGQHIQLDYKPSKNALILRNDAGLISDDLAVLDAENVKLY